ncbi:hypothetical protein HYT58_00305 [Candidatus Woesearchaeota archaeon]|nr:hypothetical protein [Candidatus Woesearchaeota archaeon]
MTAPKRTKGQLEMGENIMVLFAIVILFGLGLFLYYKFVYQGLQDVGGEISEQESSILLVSVASLPEIGCDDTDACLDSTKLTLFKSFSKDKLQYYRNKWGYRKIWAEQVYPAIKNNNECTPVFYNSLEYPENCKYWVLYENKPIKAMESIKVSSIYPIYFPEKDVFRVGRLNIEVYR